MQQSPLTSQDVQQTTLYVSHKNQTFHWKSIALKLYKITFAIHSQLNDKPPCVGNIHTSIELHAGRMSFEVKFLNISLVELRKPPAFGRCTTKCRKSLIHLWPSKPWGGGVLKFRRISASLLLWLLFASGVDVSACDAARCNITFLWRGVHLTFADIACASVRH